MGQRVWLGGLLTLLMSRLSESMVEGTVVGGLLRHNSSRSPSHDAKPVDLPMNRLKVP